ncbi:WG repeat-containing protein [Flavobacterium sp.]|uniref:WG repeat-containing protein n=1 Tax=Flavobacterium sp. TaxID=239 RepID=UPI00404758FB
MKKLFLFVLLSTVFSYSQNSELIPFVSASKWGFSDRVGKIMIQPVYDSVGFFNTSSVGVKYLTFAYVYHNQKMGVIDTKNKVLLPLQYSHLRNVTNSFHFIATNDEGKLGLVAADNQLVLPFEYDAIDDILNNSYLLKKQNKIGLADASGKIVIPIVYDQIVYVDEDDRTEKCRWRVNNEKITQYLYTAIYNNPNDEIYMTVPNVTYKDKAAISYTLDENSKDFEEKIPIRYESNLFLLRKKNLYGFIDVKEKIGFKPKFKQLEYFFNSYDFKYGKKHYLFVEENDKKGLVDGNGNILLEAIYNDIKKEYQYLKVINETQLGIFFLTTNKVVFSDFNKIKTSIVLDNNFVMVLVENTEDNSYFYIGENGVIFKN